MKHKLAEIIAMWNANHSSAEIAAKYGVTRNVIVGLMKRARDRGEDVIKKQAATGGRRKKVVKPKPTVPELSNKAKVLPFRAKFVPKTVVPGHVLITDLEYQQCKYPERTNKEGQHLFCARPTNDNRVYCEKHHKLCYDAARSKPTIQSRANLRNYR